MIFFTSDWHLGHQNILQYDNRPFSSIEEHDQALIDNFNSTVKPGDITYFLGDMGFCCVSKLKHIISSLNGTKIFLMGNHDKHQIAKYYEIGFSAVLHEATIKCGQSLFKLSHYQYKHSFLKRWWIRISTGKRYDTMNKNAPVRTNEDWLLHGHRHNKDILIEWDKKMISIGCYMHDYKPVSINEIFKIISVEENKRKR